MRVGPLLDGAGLQTPIVLAMTGLTGVDRVDVRPAPRWLRRLWIGDTAAMTFVSRVWMSQELLDGDPVRLGRLLVHELVHVRQYGQIGVVRFLGLYLFDYVRARIRGRSHRDAYRSIRYEAEARSIAGV